MKRFFEWLYFNENREKIRKIYSPIQFLIDSKRGQRSHVIIIWDMQRIKILLNRLKEWRIKK